MSWMSSWSLHSGFPEANFVRDGVRGGGDRDGREFARPTAAPDSAAVELGMHPVERARLLRSPA